MRIVVVGAGRVGLALADGFARVGHEVRLAVRDPQRASGTEVRHPLVELAAARDADLVVLAVPFMAAVDALTSLELADGSIVVDVTNTFRGPAPEGFASGAEWIAHHAPGIRLVKAFNVLGAEHMSNPDFGGPRAVLPVAADDAAARTLVVELAESMGFEAVPVGGLASSALLEAAARYWGLLALTSGLGRGIALGVLRADERAEG